MTYKWEAIAQDLTEERDRLKAALETSVIAINDWLHAYAGEMCDEKYVKETMQRISDAGGTLAYIAKVQADNRAALKSEKQ